MSHMEVYYGAFEKSDLPLEPEDTDEFYNLEKSHGKHFVKVQGQLYAFWSLQKVDEYGFSMIIEPSEQTRFIAYWYNGGAGIHEVVENLIERSIK